jgi:hypothetical protein
VEAAGQPDAGSRSFKGPFIIVASSTRVRFFRSPPVPRAVPPKPDDDQPSHYNVWGTIVGLFFVGIAVDGFTLLGAPSSATQVFDGLALVASVAVSIFSARARPQGASRSA